MTNDQVIQIRDPVSCVILAHLCTYFSFFCLAVLFFHSHVDGLQYTHAKQRCWQSSPICVFMHAYFRVCVCMCINVCVCARVGELSLAIHLSSQSVVGVLLIIAGSCSLKGGISHSFLYYTD